RLAPLPRTLQCSAGGAPRGPAERRVERASRRLVRPTTRHQGGAGRVSRRPLPGLAGALTRPERAFRAFCRRVKIGETPGYPPLRGGSRYTSHICRPFGNGVTRENGVLILSRIGRLMLRWFRPIAGAPKTVTISREEDGWYACFSCADVPMQPLA